QTPIAPNITAHDQLIQVTGPESPWHDCTVMVDHRRCVAGVELLYEFNQSVRGFPSSEFGAIVVGSDKPGIYNARIEKADKNFPIPQVGGKSAADDIHARFARPVTIVSLFYVTGQTHGGETAGDRNYLLL